MNKVFNKFAEWVSCHAGRPISFVLACACVVVWGLTGPFFGFGTTWQLVINTGTTIITFLMVFVLQATQNRDGQAVQAKLDELIRSQKEADNKLIGADHRTAEEVEALRHQVESGLAPSPS